MEHTVGVHLDCGGIVTRGDGAGVDQGLRGMFTTPRCTRCRAINPEVAPPRQPAMVPRHTKCGGEVKSQRADNFTFHFCKTCNRQVVDSEVAMRPKQNEEVEVEETNWW